MADLPRDTPRKRLTREEVDLTYDHWLAENPYAQYHSESHGWGREAWHAAYEQFAESETPQKDAPREHFDMCGIRYGGVCNCPVGREASPSAEQNNQTSCIGMHELQSAAPQVHTASKPLTTLSGFLTKDGKCPGCGSWAPYPPAHICTNPDGSQMYPQKQRDDKNSATPRTDAFYGTAAWGLAENFARQLERELAEAHEQIDAAEAGWSADTSAPSAREPFEIPGWIEVKLKDWTSRPRLIDSTEAAGSLREAVNELREYVHGERKP